MNLTQAGSLNTPLIVEDSICVTEGLVAWYPFNGDANDRSGNLNHTTVHGATLVTGIDGMAYEFDGSSYIHPDDDSTIAPITITFWINTSNSGEQVILAGVGESSYSWNGSLGIYSGKINIRYHDSGSTDRREQMDAVISDGAWHHVALIDTGGSYPNRYNYYLDGQLTTKSTGGQGRISYNFVIGRRIYDSNAVYFTGMLSDIRIYNRALTPEEINIIYEQTGGSNNKMKISGNTIYLKGEINEIT